MPSGSETPSRTLSREASLPGRTGTYCCPGRVTKYFQGRESIIFGPKRPIPGISNLSRQSSFGFGIGPEAYFGINLLYNHSWNWAWGKTYFSDVNQDGLNDPVDNGTVYFNHVGANGDPAFNIASSTTAVPIDTGTVDPASRSQPAEKGDTAAPSVSV